MSSEASTAGGEDETELAARPGNSRCQCCLQTPSSPRRGGAEQTRRGKHPRRGGCRLGRAVGSGCCGRLLLASQKRSPVSPVCPQEGALDEGPLRKRLQREGYTSCTTTMRLLLNFSPHGSFLGLRGSHEALLSPSLLIFLLTCRPRDSKQFSRASFTSAPGDTK